MRGGRGRAVHWQHAGLQPAGQWGCSQAIRVKQLQTWRGGTGGSRAEGFAPCLVQ